MSCFLNYSWQRCRCIFILFFWIQIFFWSNFRYVAKPFYLKIGKSCLISCFGIAEIKNRPVVFTSTFLRKNPLTRHTFNRSRANLNGPIRNTFIVFCWKQSKTVLLQGSPELLIFLLYMHRRALGRDCFSRGVNGPCTARPLNILHSKTEKAKSHSYFPFPA